MSTSNTTTTDALDLSGDLGYIFNLDPEGWAPRTDVYAQALEAAMGAGAMLPSNQAVYAALRLRGFRETKIDGVMGFKGIRAAYSRKVVQNHHNTGAPVHQAPWMVAQPE